MPIADGTDPALPWKPFYAAVDAMAIDPFMAFLHPDASMRVANYPVVQGLDEIRRLVAGAWSNWRKLTHNIENVWEEGDTTIVEATIDHEMADGRIVVTPCVTIIEWRDGKLFRHRAFEDPRPIEPQS